MRGKRSRDKFRASSDNGCVVLESVSVEDSHEMKTIPTKKLESLRRLGLHNLGQVHWDLSTPSLYEEAIRRYEGMLSHLGPLVIRTGQYTGRSPNDKFLVREPSSESKIWWGKVNRPFAPETFDALTGAPAAPICKARTSSSRTATPAPTEHTACPSA